jgi:hypothetical protein
VTRVASQAAHGPDPRCPPPCSRRAQPPSQHPVAAAMRLTGASLTQQLPLQHLHCYMHAAALKVLRWRCVPLHATTNRQPLRRLTRLHASLEPHTLHNKQHASYQTCSHVWCPSPGSSQSNGINDAHLLACPSMQHSSIVQSRPRHASRGRIGSQRHMTHASAAQHSGIRP